MRVTNWVSTILVLMSNCGIALGQEVKSTGLTFLDDDAYKSIPLATTPLMGTLPTSVDLSNSFPAPGDQGNQASCVGWATGYAFKSYQENVERGWQVNTADHVFSPSYIYNQIRRTPSCQAGTLLVDALNLLRREGAAPLRDFPYNDQSCAETPTPATKQIARQFAIADWRRVNMQDETEIRTQIASGFPIIIGMEVDAAFMNLRAGSVYSRFAGPSLGGHAMVIVGYDDAKRSVKVINSWRTTWADGGFGWISFQAVKQAVREGYVAQDIVVVSPSPGPPQPKPAPKSGSYWQQLPGTGTDIGIGAKGAAWIIGTSPCNDDGCAIYRFDGTRFQQIDGEGIRIAVDPSGEPWVVNRKGGIYRHVDGRWRQLEGSAVDIGIGAEGSVWVIGTEPSDQNGFGIYRLSGTHFEKIDGSAMRVAVDKSGNPWVVNRNRDIYRRVAGRFEQLPGSAIDIGIGADGSVWVIGTNGDSSGYQIYRWSGTDWSPVNGSGVAIAVGADGMPWVTNLQKSLYRLAN